MRESIRSFVPPGHDANSEPVEPKIKKLATIELVIEVPGIITHELDLDRIQEYVALAFKKEGDEYFQRNSAVCKGKEGKEAAQRANTLLCAYDSAKVKLKRK
tara:strand:- start:699 stop:1004 length:306 start_codon:yes stop_codon:yes gene_type:complete